MPPRPKQHHYVTKAYLDGFLEPGCPQLVCYSRHRQAPFCRTPQDLATQRNYHSFKRADGTWDDSLELKLQKDVEDPGLCVLRLLANGKTRLSWGQRDQMSLLVATQRFRVPHIRRVIDSQNLEAVRAWLSEYELRERETGGNPGRMIIGVSGGMRPGRKHEIEVTKAELKEMLETCENDPEGFSREEFMNLAASFSKIFRTMKWTMYYASGPSRFITSDCPAAMHFVRRDIDTISIARPDCRILFPLSKSSLLLMEHDMAVVAKLKEIGPTPRGRRLLNRLPEIRIVTASAGDVQSFNEIQADQASRWVFAGQQSNWVIARLQSGSKNVRQVVRKVNRNLTMVTAVEGE
jgi:hypothetical protein